MKKNTVVLIHGFGEDHSIWNTVIADLKNEFDFFAVKVPGSSLPLPENGDLSMETLADAVIDQMKTAGITKAAVIGHSMGGYVALAMMERQPELFSALGLFHSSAYADNEEKIETRRKGIRVMQEKGDRAFLKTAVPGLFHDQKKHEQDINALVEGSDAFAPGALAAYYEGMMARPDRTDLLRNAAVPVLFIGGRHDKAVLADQLLEQSHLPAVSYVHMLEDSAHMGMIEERDKAAGILREFLQSLPA